MQTPNAVPEGADIDDILAELPVGLYGRYYATVGDCGGDYFCGWCGLYCDACRPAFADGP